VIGIFLRRIASAVPILLIVSLMTFGLMHLIPGDPAAAIAGLSATPQQILQLRHDLGLDEPFIVQLADWYGGLLHGNLGRSLLMGQPVADVMLFRLPVTIALAAYALVLTVVFGLIAGIFSALRQNTWVDTLSMVFAMFGISVPNFWLGLLMIIFFAVWLGWLPTGGYIAFTDDPIGWLRTSTMPAISLGLLQVGLLARITRSSMLEVLRQDYIRTARAKGLPGGTIVLVHALPNMLVPLSTSIGIIFGGMLSATFVVETIFNIPGLGRLAIDSIFARDYPVITAIVLLFTVFYALINLAVDLLYAAIDPRIRQDNVREAAR